MRWPTALLIYSIIWWLVLFMVLPWGNQAIDQADTAKGHMAGAPQRPRILIKFAVTTAIAGVFFAAFYWVYTSGLISFRL
jgi:predicted secreted protein